MPSDKDIVTEARDVAKNLIAGRPRVLLFALADEVEQLRATVLRLTQEPYDDDED